MTAIAVTGLGVASPLGDDVASFWQAVIEERPALAPLERLSDPVLARCPAGQLRSRPDPSEQRDPCGPLALGVARQAFRQARLDELAGDRIAVVLGTSAAGMTLRSRYERERGDSSDSRKAELLRGSRTHHAVRHVAEGLGAGGPRLTVSTACTSSMIAVAHGMQLLRSGQADAVLAGGVDLVVEELAAGFFAIGAMSDEPCDPFGFSRGMNLGEGAGVVVLERAEDAERRGISAIVALTGFGLAADAYHATSPDPTGAGAVRAIERAIRDAGLSPDDIVRFDAHGTGTEANDAAERAALEQIFGARAEPLGVTAFKRLFGHALGAAGALELIALIGVLCDEARRDGVASIHAVSHGAAFGGSEAALVVSTRAASRPSAAERRVVVVGWDRLCAAPGSEQVDEEGLASAIDGRLERRADRLTKLLFASVAGALRHAGIEVCSATRCRGSGRVARDRIGLFVGTGQLPAAPAETFWRRALERGYHRTSGPAFSRMVLNAPAGAVVRALELEGPLSVIADGRGAGLTAAVLAGELLRQRDDVDVIVVASAFEIGRAVRDALVVGGARESSAAVVLAREDWAKASGVEACVRLAGASFARGSDARRDTEPRDDAADLVALAEACERASRSGAAVVNATSDAGAHASLSLIEVAGASAGSSHRKATDHG